MPTSLSATLLDARERDMGGAGRLRRAALMLLALITPCLGYCGHRDGARQRGEL